MVTSRAPGGPAPPLTSQKGNSEDDDDEMSFGLAHSSPRTPGLPRSDLSMQIIVRREKTL